MSKRSEATKLSRTAARMKKSAPAMTGASPSARLRAEERAEETAAYLAAIVESAEDAIVSKTLNGIVTSWNASAERMFGYTEQEMLGQPILRVIPPERRSEEDLILTRIRAGERIEHFETVRMRKDGQPLHVSLTISPGRDRAGVIIGASKIVRDITERRRLEHEVANWAAQLDATFDALTDGFFIYDSAGQLTRMNDAARTILALDAAPDYYSLTPAERAARLQVRDVNDRPLKPEEWGLTKLAQGERLVEPVEIRITALDGRTKDLSITGGPVRATDGEIVGAVALLRDVTDRRRLERAVAERSAQLQATFDALAEPMCVFDAKGRILRQNRAEMDLFGFDPPQPRSKSERRGSSCAHPMGRGSRQSGFLRAVYSLGRHLLELTRLR